MSIVVADTGPLHYLVLTDQIHLLHMLFGVVLVPHAVRAEMDHAETPLAVRNWIADPPGWLSVRAELADSAVLSARADHLDKGERAAIALAMDVKAGLILMDDRAGVAFAREAGFSVMGTLGVLDLGARRGLVDLAAALDSLQKTNFRCRPSVMKDLLARYEAGIGQSAQFLSPR